MPANAAKAKPQPKVVKARRIITVDAIDENGRQRGLLERAKIYGQKRRPKKPLTDLFTKLAEKTVDGQNPASVYETPFVIHSVRAHGSCSYF